MSHPQPNPTSIDAMNAFATRSASQAWEQVAIADSPQFILWVWFKPANTPQGLVIRVADETWSSFPNPEQLTMRRLLYSVGIAPEIVASWQLLGTSFEGMNGTNPLLDNPVPPPVENVDPNIVVNIQTAMPQTMPMAPQAMPMAAQPMPQAMAQPMPQMAQPMQPMPQAATNSPMDTTWLAEMFDRIEMEWNSILDVEGDMEQIRKMLVEASGRLRGLNRDLSSDERLFASHSDEREWLDARRMLREADMRLWACVKDYDSGDASSAGNRRWLAQLYEQFVQIRQPFDGIEQALGNFEFHRKVASMTQQKMNGALLNASNNAERNAQNVINRITAKVREGNQRPGFLEAMQD